MAKVAAIVLAVTLTLSCRKEEPAVKDGFNENVAVNYFTRNMLLQFYLWADERDEELHDGWDFYADPFQNVKDIRYVTPEGKLADRWTAVYDDISELTAQVSGSYQTYGFGYRLYYESSGSKKIVAVVTYVYAGGPAEKAGLRRGDVIATVNGTAMDTDNYVNVVENGFYGSGQLSLGVYGKEAHVVLNSVDMYCDPVLQYKVFDVNGKKVGYLVYTSFVADSYQRLMEACKYFKNEGVTELVLDLRYNGGGLVKAEYTLASMLAPEQAVTNGELYQKNIYNSYVAKQLTNDSNFTTKFKFENSGKKYEYSTADCNVPLAKIYALVSSSTASASESLLTGLGPYLDIEILGEQTHGKYCSGIIESAAEWYEEAKKSIPESYYEGGVKYAADWGLYVMIGLYADKNGETPCMPDGFIPDVTVKDNPVDGYMLGDPDETMLKAALSRAGYVYRNTSSTIERKVLQPAPYQGRNTPVGLRVL